MMKAAAKERPWSLKGAAVLVPESAPDLARFAANELARYLYQVTGAPARVVTEFPERGIAVILDRRIAASLGITAEAVALGPQGYRLTTARKGKLRCVVITAGQPVGILYGVYGLLEEIGLGFYAGGDTFPDLPAPARLSPTINRCERPVFTVRGNMLHYNFLCGCTDWGLADYRFYFDQLARMRCNLLLMHWYDNEPGAAYEFHGEYRAGGITPNSLTRPWGALAALRTAEFSFGTGRFFDEEIYSSPMGADRPDLLTEIKRTEAVFSEATRYARGAGVDVAAGFETPREDPARRDVQQRFEARLGQFLERNPHLSRFALWQHEAGGCVGSVPPAAGSPGAELLAKRRDCFAYLGNEQRIWEAVRYGRFAELAVAILAREAPRVKLVLVGWGGDRWMQFADYCLGYDAMLPPTVAFTCHDNIDASMGPNVSTPWGQLPARRERWAMPWVEGDIDECAVRQPHVESLGLLAPDALRKGCQGLLTLQWRTRDVEEETGYIARFAWDPTLTPDRFYRRLARQAFGPDQEETMGQHLATLQRLGARWTGVRGTVECGSMQWTGWRPHFPFEVNSAAVEFLVPKAEAAAAALAEIPAAAEGEAAFHLLPRDAKDNVAGSDASRPGVRELKDATARLRTLSPERNPERIRTELSAIEESVYAIRPKLVAFGMTSRSYLAVDGFLIAIHHLRRNAGARGRMRTLRAIRGHLDDLRSGYVAGGRTSRLERLDYLAATMDFALHFDAAAMLLADGERVDQALAAAKQAGETGQTAQAAAVAAQAYIELLEAGMPEAIAAFARKLTTRCDFGTLATLNVKPLPLYWQTLGRLEEFFPAVPPRELQVRGQEKEVWISWTPGPRTAGQHLYRRSAGSAKWTRANRQPLAAACGMFVDRPTPGAYDYAVTALDKDGQESPRSHPARTVCGPLTAGPRLVASKPCSRLETGTDLEVRIVAISDRDVRSVKLHWRQIGERRWQESALSRRFRDAYAGGIPAARIVPGALEFFVAATDAEGHRAVWPETAPALAWGVTVTRRKGPPAKRHDD